jgi:hypothetical protein
MEAIQKIETISKPLQVSKRALFSKNVKKYYMEIEDIFVRKTQAERRKELFGKDPMVEF